MTIMKFPNKKRLDELTQKYSERFITLLNQYGLHPCSLHDYFSDEDAHSVIVHCVRNLLEMQYNVATLMLKHYQVFHHGERFAVPTNLYRLDVLFDEKPIASENFLFETITDSETMDGIIKEQLARNQESPVFILDFCAQNGALSVEQSKSCEQDFHQLFNEILAMRDSNGMLQ